MHLEQKNYNKETVRQLKKEMDVHTVNGGYPLFNDFNHTTLDMSKIDELGHTLSIKIGDNRYVTFSFMKADSEGKTIDIDVLFHGEGETTVIRLDGKQDVLNDLGLFAIINKLK